MPMKPSLPKGTRDFLPETMSKRTYITDVIRSVFTHFGFAPIETPAMENLSTLTGKYGEEGDRLIFKILNSGDFLAKANEQAIEEGDAGALTQSIAEKALRYDLTVPFARFVVQNQQNLQMPFKRYQIQPVWRADRPQKGRFREFYQCDADVVGSYSLLQELEFISIYQQVFEKLNVSATIRLNNRKILAGIAEAFDISDKLIDFTVSLDKMDKIGEEGVIKELDKKGFGAKAIEGFKQIVRITGKPEDQLKQLEQVFQASAIGKSGIEDTRFLIENVDQSEKVELALDLSLARGLDYYTGSIFEVVANDVEIGSIGGGGRYADLTSVFGRKDLPGVGISFGLDRIFLVMEEQNLFPEATNKRIDIMLANFGEKEALYGLKLANELRKLEVNVDVYPDAAKMKKQLDFANRNQISFVLLIGSAEMESGVFTLKDMESGTQEALSRIELLERFGNNTKKNAPYGRH
jgi:histidyl-tRNA synthetase